MDLYMYIIVIKQSKIYQLYNVDKEIWENKQTK